MPNPSSDCRTEEQCDVEMRGDYLVLFDGDGQGIEYSRCVTLRDAKATLGNWFFVKGYDWINSEKCGRYIQNYFKGKP